MASSSFASSDDKKIQEYNKYLVDNDIKLTIKEYIFKLNELIYKQDFGHVEFFMDLVGKDEMFIHHTKFKEYDIITTDKSSDVKRLLDQYNYKKNKDYYSSEEDDQDKLLTIQEQELRKKVLLRNVAQQKNKDNRGGSNKNEYIVHPRVFKYCAMRAKNTDRFTVYYLTIEEIFKYFNDFQHLYKDKLLSMKDDKIDELSRDIKELLNRSDKVLNTLTDVKEELQDVKEELIETNTILSDTNVKLDVVLEDRVMIKDVLPRQLQTFLILKTDNEKYKIVYGSNTYINSEIKKIYSTKFDQLQQNKIKKLNKKLTDYERELAIKRINREIIKYLLNQYTTLKLEKVPNTYYLRELIRKKLIGCTFTNSYMTLIDKTEENMKTDILNIYEERKKQDNIV